MEDESLLSFLIDISVTVGVSYSKWMVLSGANVLRAPSAFASIGTITAGANTDVVLEANIVAAPGNYVQFA